MTGDERYNELYDEMENLARKLVEIFDMERKFDEHEPERKHRIDPEILMARVGALHDVAEEMRFLKKFRGSLRLIK